MIFGKLFKKIKAGKSKPSAARERLPKVLPILPVRDVVIFPGMVVPLLVGRERSLRAIAEAEMRTGYLGIITQKAVEIEEPDFSDLYEAGVVVNIIRIVRGKKEEEGLKILVEGLRRFKVKRFVRAYPLIEAVVEYMPHDSWQELRPILNERERLEIEALSKSIGDLFEQMAKLGKNVPMEAVAAVRQMEDPIKIVNLIAGHIDFKIAEKQQILQTVDLKERMKKLAFLLAREIQLLQINNEIQSKIVAEIGRAQREFYLREQLKAIQKELGESGEKSPEIKELKEKIESCGMPEEVKKVAYKELERLQKTPPAAAEYIVTRTYLDWLVSVPWTTKTEDNLDLKKAAKILDKSHYGLKKAKERILEFLAVRKLKEKMKGPILCFVGPPGVGKTSLGKSIAEALGRKFVRISLGGIRDEAEIRGHRRTYVGALPGRIIQGMKQAGTINPVFMLDEVDKIGADFRGDPAAALLEVLDPEQNHAFVDHYLDVPYDLSNVFFITTANFLDPIPPALKDRMEVIHLPGYTEEEKLQIAKRHLIPKLLEEHGLTKKHLRITDEAIRKIIRNYTYEAGVRNLERILAAIMRKVARRVAEGKKSGVVVTPRNLQKYLGPEKYRTEKVEEVDRVGVATGLAWTEAGGDILFVEATKMKGKGNLILTGQLGDVMQESAKAALSYVRTYAEDLGVKEPNFYEKYDIHVHVPEGAVPKDGPSAGVAVLTALASLLTEVPVRREVAMTGEITLRGKILPVGGIRAKLLAARRAGIKEVIIPEENRKDLEEFDEQEKRVLQSLKLHFVNNAREVLQIALRKTEEDKPVKKTASANLGLKTAS